MAPPWSRSYKQPEELGLGKMEKGLNKETNTTTRRKLTREIRTGELPLPQPPRGRVRKKWGVEGVLSRGNGRSGGGVK